MLCLKLIGLNSPIKRKPKTVMFSAHKLYSYIIQCVWNASNIIFTRSSNKWNTPPASNINLHGQGHLYKTNWHLCTWRHGLDVNSLWRQTFNKSTLCAIFIVDVTGIINYLFRKLKIDFVLFWNPVHEICYIVFLMSCILQIEYLPIHSLFVFYSSFDEKIIE